MALIVEDGTGLADAESYASIARAEELLATRSDAGISTWLGTQAAGTLTLTGVPGNTETVTIGGRTYTFQTTLTNFNGNVLIGATAADSLANLFAAIALGPGAGVVYADATTQNVDVEATGVTATTLTVTAITRGAVGNGIATLETLATTGSQWGGAYLTGGATASVPTSTKENRLREGTRYLELVYGDRLQGNKKTQAQALQIPRTDMVVDGYDVDDASVPFAFELATVLLALKAGTDAPLLPDVTAANSGTLVSKSVQAGPVSVAKSYTSSGVGTFKRYTEISALITPYLAHSVGRMVRA